MYYINSESGEYPVSEQRIRQENPNTSFGTPFEAPAKYKYVFPKPQPAFNALTHKAVEASPSLTGSGRYQQDWEIVPLDMGTASENLSKIRFQKAEAIKAYRDKLKEAGVPVDGKRFHSDVFSRIQWLGLMIMGTQAPNIPWKTMDGSFVQLTPALVQQVFIATGVMDTTLFGVAEAKIAAMKSLDDPTLYDVVTGWPPAYTP